MKKIFDFLLALLSIIIISPIFVLLIIAIFFIQGKPILFIQTRPGYKTKPFRIYKFRTMDDKYANDGNLLPDSERLTNLGKILRRYSLDEIPQLLNVLKGDLSFVGPRPLLMEYLPLYTKTQARRHEVKPGITGWAQVNGRNLLKWEERFKMDVWYVDHQSFWLDSRILILTLLYVISGKGISQKGNVTMVKFQGSKVE